MEIVDARNAFFKRNEYCLDKILQQLTPQQQTCIQLLPLIFQLNTRQLPGYIGPDAPAGIYGYSADDAVIAQARKFSNKFVHEPELPLKNAPIDAVYLQYSIFDRRYRVWLIHAENMKAAQTELLEQKLQRVAQWLRNHDLDVVTHLTTAQDLVAHGMREKQGRYFTAAGLFLEYFYVESVLLAGKYPVWWLVPPDDEANYTAFVQHIQDARFVIESEYMDLGGAGQLTRKDILKQAIVSAQNTQSSPLLSWLELLLLNARMIGFEEVRGLAWQLKKNIYNGEREQALWITGSMRPLVKEAVAILQFTGKDVAVDKLLVALIQYAPPVEGRLLQSILDTRHEDHYQRQSSLDIMRYSQAYLGLMQYINAAFQNIHDLYDQHEPVMNDVDLLRQVHDVFDFMGESAQRIPVYNPNLLEGLVRERVLLRHEYRPVEQWSFIIQDEHGQEKNVYQSPSLLAVLAWSWLNHVVDQATQISVECPMRLVKQVEARYVLEVLMAQLNRDAVFDISKSDLRQPRRAKHAFVFINLVIDENLRQRIESIDQDMDPLSYGDFSENLVSQCEQLVISNWGDVRIQRYTGDTGVLYCLSDWMMFSFGGGKPRQLPFKAFGYAPGASTWLAQRMEEVYAEMLEFYGRKKKLSGRFIIRLGPEYYCLEADNAAMQNKKIGNEAALLQYLEQSCAQFILTGMDRLVMPAMPLRAIYQRNKEGLIQIFYRVQSRICETWILDENGSMCYFRQNWYERESYVVRWLYLLRNVRNRMKRINYQNRELPGIEIVQVSSVRLGHLEFNKITAEAVNPERNYFEIHVSVEGAEKSGRLSLNCDGREYAYAEYGEDVLNECVQYINARIMGDGRRPVYVTDLDVPLKYFDVDNREHVQTMHFLKYVRNLESRINQLIGE
jgi:adenylate cyclase class 1